MGTFASMPLAFITLSVVKVIISIVGFSKIFIVYLLLLGGEVSLGRIGIDH